MPSRSERGIQCGAWYLEFQNSWVKFQSNIVKQLVVPTKAMSTQKLVETQISLSTLISILPDSHLE